MNKLFGLYLVFKSIYRANYKSKLVVEECGTEEGLPYIKLRNGVKLSGLPSQKKFKLFPLLHRRIKRKVPPSHVYLFLDIIRRYEIHKTADSWKQGRFYDLDEGSVFVELGAFHGLHVVKLAEIVGEKGKVIAVEAMENNFRVLEKNIRDNKLVNVIAVHKAVWNKKEVLDFGSKGRQLNSANSNVISQSNVTRVPADTVDNILEDHSVERVDFIRVQVNGAEYKALKGMSRVLKKGPQLLLATPYIDTVSVLNFVEGYGYTTQSSRNNILAHK